MDLQSHTVQYFFSAPSTSWALQDILAVSDNCQLVQFRILVPRWHNSVSYDVDDVSQTTSGYAEMTMLLTLVTYPRSASF